MGLKKSCVRFAEKTVRSAKGRTRALRCVEFKKASKVGKHPKCDRRLDGGGRSKGLIRTHACNKR